MKDKGANSKTSAVRSSQLTVLNTVLLVGILAYLVISSVSLGSDEKKAFVLTGELFSQFDYQKELDQEFSAIRADRKKQLENLETEIKVFESRLANGQATDADFQEYQYLLNKYKEAQFTIDSELNLLNEEYSTKIWTKLNDYIAQFGEEKGYEIIFGATGSGNIMYAEDKYDVTEEAIVYCNEKYSGR